MPKPGALGKAIAIAWAPLAVVVLHQVVARIFGHMEDLDPLFHFAGGIAGASAVLRVLTYLPNLPEEIAAKRSWIAIAAVTVAAVSWELGEFASDRWRGTHIQQGPLDTWSDIALGIAGAVACTLLLRRRNRSSRE